MLQIADEDETSTAEDECNDTSEHSNNTATVSELPPQGEVITDQIPTETETSDTPTPVDNTPATRAATARSAAPREIVGNARAPGGTLAVAIHTPVNLSASQANRAPTPHTATTTVNLPGANIVRHPGMPRAALAVQTVQTLLFMYEEGRKAKVLHAEWINTMLYDFSKYLWGETTTFPKVDNEIFAACHEAADLTEKSVSGIFFGRRRKRTSTQKSFIYEQYYNCFHKVDIVPQLAREFFATDTGTAALDAEGCENKFALAKVRTVLNSIDIGSQLSKHNILLFDNTAKFIINMLVLRNHNDNMITPRSRNSKKEKLDFC